MIYKLLPTRVYRAYLGGEHLDALQKKEAPSVSRFPEDWLGSVTLAFNPGREMPGEGLSLTEDGRTLKELIEQHPQDMIGHRERMSLLFKLLDSSERLVIQAHPTVDFAKTHFHSPFGKAECWYFLGDGGYVYIGFREGVTKEHWQSLFRVQDTEGMLDCLHRFEVKRGDFIFVNGGVPHAIGAGCFLAELQEPTDLMVIPERTTPSGIRLADEKMHGGLGFESMFDCFVYEGLDRERTRESYFKTPRVVDSGRTVIVDESITDKFRLDLLCVSGTQLFQSDSYGIALVSEGCGEINGVSLEQGDRVFIPEHQKELRLRGHMQLLLCRP